MNRPLAAGLAAMFVATALQGQVSGRIDALVGSSPAFSTGNPRGHWGLSPAAAFQSARLRIDAESEFGEGTGPLGAATGSLGLSHFTHLQGAVLGELTGSTRFRYGFAGRNGTSWNAGVGLHLRGESEGAWLRLSAGRDLNGGSARWEATAWRRLGTVSLQLSGSQTSTVDIARFATQPTDSLSPPTDSTTIPRVEVATDIGAWLRWAPARFELAVGIGRRYGTREVAPSPAGTPVDGTNNRTSAAAGRLLVHDWWLAEAAWKLTPLLGLVGSVGQTPPDLQFGTPAGKFVRLAIRASFGRASAPAVRRPANAAGVRAIRLRNGEVELAIVVAGNAGTRRVEIMGDFTDWLPIELLPAGDGRWCVRLGITPGLHYLNVRYDGGPWQPPPGTAVVADEFERLTGVVSVD
jgi:hypothetical protein